MSSDKAQGGTTPTPTPGQPTGGRVHDSVEGMIEWRQPTGGRVHDSVEGMIESIATKSSKPINIPQPPPPTGPHSGPRPDCQIL